MDLRSSHDYNTFGPGISLSFFAYHFEGFIQRMPGPLLLVGQRA